MGRGRPKKNREPKRKAVKVRLAPRLHAGQVTEPYRIMEAIIAKDRRDLDGVKIGIAWHTGWRPDADGVRTHGKCVKRSDLDRSIDGPDVVIILNEQSWQAFDDEQKQRLIFHELEHAQIARNKNGEPLIDDKGRIVIRMKRHDVADFACVIERFGLSPCLQDVDINDGNRPLLKLAGKTVTTEATEITEKAGMPKGSERLEIKCSGMKKARVTVDLICEAPGRWRVMHKAQLGNYAGQSGTEQAERFASPSAALNAVQLKIGAWLDNLELSGTADQKRSLTQRRDAMRKQVNAALDARIRAMRATDEVPFDEDPPRDASDEEDDGDENEEI